MLGGLDRLTLKGIPLADSSATVSTENGSKYLQQLCKHWSHNLDVSFDDHEGTVRFDQATATMKAEPGVLLVAIEAEDPAIVERMKQVLADHLNRFAFREAPLAFNWS